MTVARATSNGSPHVPCLEACRCAFLPAGRAGTSESIPGEHARLIATSVKSIGLPCPLDVKGTHYAGGHNAQPMGSLMPKHLPGPYRLCYHFSGPDWRAAPPA